MLPTRALIIVASILTFVENKQLPSSFDEIQSEVEAIARSQQVLNLFSAIESEVSRYLCRVRSSCVIFTPSSPQLTEVPGSPNLEVEGKARCEYEEECYRSDIDNYLLHLGYLQYVSRSGYWGGIVCDCRECCNNYCSLPTSWVSWSCWDREQREQPAQPRQMTGYFNKWAFG